MYNYAILVGRFQPFHAGHQSIVDEALTKSEKVIILVGSANRARSPKNPFTFEERTHIISELFKYEVSIGRVIIHPIDDFMYNDSAWIANVQKSVNTLILEDYNGSKTHYNHGMNNIKICLLGYEKDYSSGYLKFFPQWEKENISIQNALFNSTNIREDYFRFNPMISSISTPDAVSEFLRNFITTPDFKWVVGEKLYYENYKHLWKDAPFPVTINCVDAVATQSGHILLVTRKNHPGKGLLALPGGHIDINETMRNAVVRELREETKISDNKGEMPPAVVASFIKDEYTKTYDDPNRSERGRVITQAYRFVFPDTKDLFKVRGDDDAEKAQWIPLGNLKANDFFEDHAFIIMDQLSISF